MYTYTCILCGSSYESNLEENALTVHTDTSTAPLSPVDEILKFKSLLDCGAITEEEYETVKKRLLDF